MLENGTTREDMKLPSGTDDYEKLAEQLVEEVKAEKEVIVTVLKVGRFSSLWNPCSTRSQQMAQSPPGIG